MPEKIKIKKSELNDIYDIEDDIKEVPKEKSGETLKAYSERIDLEIEEND